MDLFKVQDIGCLIVAYLKEKGDEEDNGIVVLDHEMRTGMNPETNNKLKERMKKAEISFAFKTWVTLRSVCRSWRAFVDQKMKRPFFCKILSDEFHDFPTCPRGHAHGLAVPLEGPSMDGFHFTTIPPLSFVVGVLFWQLFAPQLINGCRQTILKLSLSLCEDDILIDELSKKIVEGRKTHPFIRHIGQKYFLFAAISCNIVTPHLKISQSANKHTHWLLLHNKSSFSGNFNYFKDAQRFWQSSIDYIVQDTKKSCQKSYMEQLVRLKKADIWKIDDYLESYIDPEKVPIQSLTSLGLNANRHQWIKEAHLENHNFDFLKLESEERAFLDVFPSNIIWSQWIKWIEDLTAFVALWNGRKRCKTNFLDKNFSIDCRKPYQERQANFRDLQFYSFH